MPKKPTGFTKRQVKAAAAAREQASSAPREVAAALLADGSEFQPVTLCTVLVLESIESPFIKGTTSNAPMLDVTRALYVLSQPIEEVDALVARSRHASEKRPFDLFDVKVKEFARGVPLGGITSLGAKIDAHIARAMSTMIPHGEANTGPLAERPAPVLGSAGT